MNRRNAVTLTEVLIAIFVLSIGLMALLSLFPIGAAQMAQALKDQRSAEAANLAGPQARMQWKEACITSPNARGTDPQFSDPTGQSASVQRYAYALDDPNLNNLFKDNNGLRPYALPATVPTTLKSSQVKPAYTDMFSLKNGIPGRASVVSSYPVFVDPIGWEANYKAGATARMLWVGNPLSTVQAPIYQTVLVNGAPAKKFGLIPRRPLYVPNPTATAAVAPWVALGSSDPLTPVVLNKSQRILSRFSLLHDLGFN